jgi:hypothetical protein
MRAVPVRCAHEEDANDRAISRVKGYSMGRRPPLYGAMQTFVT